MYLILTEDDADDDENHVFQGTEGVMKVNNLDVKLSTCLGVCLIKLKLGCLSHYQAICDVGDV